MMATTHLFLNAINRISGILILGRSTTVWDQNQLSMKVIFLQGVSAVLDQEYNFRFGEIISGLYSAAKDLEIHVLTR